MKTRITIATTILALFVGTSPLWAVEGQPTVPDAASIARPDAVPIADDPRQPPYTDIYTFYKPHLVLRAAIVSLSNLLTGDPGDERVDECDLNGILPDCPES